MTNLQTLLTFLPVALYLATVWAFQLARKPVPLGLHIAGAVTGLAVNGILTSWIAPLVSLTFGLAFFVVAVFVAGRFMTRTGIIVFSVALAAAPPVTGWLGLLSGVMLAAVVSFILIARSMGRNRATFTVYESVGSIGVSPMMIPTLDESRIPATPLEEQAAQAEERLEQSSIRRRPPIKALRLAPFMLIGVIAAAVVTAYLN